MCSTCGCGSEEGGVKILAPGQKPEHHHHDHSHDHDHHHHHSHDGKSIIEIEKDILSNNNLLAARNRGFFEAKNITALNLVSSPGSGKTTLLEATLRDLKGEIEFAVIEGDQQTTNDADRINALDVSVMQINTGKGCHLDSEMVYDAFKAMNLKDNSVLMIENVGNLVCPALFDLGETKRVVIISTTEGDDKPLKYPDMFAHADVCIVNKIDLLPYVNFDMETAKQNALRINHHLEFFEVSATSGEGMCSWKDWLKSTIITAD